MKAPRLDPNADAEVLLWEVRVTDSVEFGLSTTLDHYLRIKVFTDRGRETQGRVELPYANARRLSGIEGRTIGPDGAIAELRSQDVFDRTIVETTGLKLRVKSFVLPAVVPGAMIEYRWREVRDDAIGSFLELPFQRDIPTHLVRYRLRPLAVRDFGFEMLTESYNMVGQVERVREDDGYTSIIARNVPALRSERFMPPALSLKPWLLVYYAPLGESGKSPDAFWSSFARRALNQLEARMRVTTEIRRAARESGAVGAPGAPPSIEALVAYARSRVARDDTDTAVGEERPNKTATDAWKRGRGNGVDQVLLVAAMAQAVRLDVRLALLPNRRQFLSEPGMRQPYFLDRVAVALRTPSGWSFVDPANEHAKGGHLDWAQEGQYALILDDKKPELVPVPVAPESLSTRKRVAALSLSEDGTLSGRVTVAYSGHVATARRERDDAETPQERERLFVEELTRRMPGVVISDVVFEHLDNPDEPYTIRFSLRVPAYGQRAGSRLLVQPGVLERGAEPVFSDAARAYPILLPYAYHDEDRVSIEIPAGYELEPDQGPTPVTLAGGVWKYDASVSMTEQQVSYTRSQLVGGGGRLSFGPEDYHALKAFFDAVVLGDAYTMSLRRPVAGGRSE